MDNRLIQKAGKLVVEGATTGVKRCCWGSRRVLLSIYIRGANHYGGVVF
jgi:hypothetical protein